MRRLSHNIITMGAACALFGTPLFAQEQDQQAAEQRLGEIEAEIKDREDKADALREEAARAEEEAQLTKESLIGLAETIQTRESEATALELSIAELQIEYREKSNSLDGRRQDMVELLATLERLGNRPTALALMQPTEALDTVRTANLLSTLVPHIEKEAASLKIELKALDAIGKKLRGDRAALNTALDEMITARAAMSAILSRQQEQAKRAAQDADEHDRAIKKLAAEADTMRELIEKIIAANATRTNPEINKERRASMNLTNARGELLYPARGKLVERYGTAKQVGKAEGITLEVRSEAQVVAPFDGEVIFADNFRDFGLIIIIAHGDEYHSLISGLNESYPPVGTWVMKGEPIGVMDAAQNGRNPRIYIELRRKNLPINPIPWFKGN